MKLTQVQTRSPVSTGAPGDNMLVLRATQGWSLDYDAGIVDARKGEHRMLIPVGNVACMLPEATAAKGKAAA